MKHLNLVCLFILYTHAQRKPPTITIPSQGVISGKEISIIRTQRIFGYLGIPYAQPPLEKLRFSPPSTDPLPQWDGIRNATEYAPACLQNPSDITKREMPFLSLISDLKFETNEDCLYLNVFVPVGGNSPLEGFATIIWFHPGNFTTGSPSMWNPHALVYRQRVIIVTFSYRLNVMGFFTSNDGEAPGNYGLMDQQAVLTWVKKNIKLFNGNPDNISLMGYGTGAVSIGLHLILEQSQGLFSKVIMMSGNFLNPGAIKYPQEDKGLIDTLIANFGCYPKPTSALMVCLRRAPADALVTLTSHIDWRPLIDVGLSNGTAFLGELPKNYFERGDFHKVPVLTGYTSMEEVLALESISDVPKEGAAGDFITTVLTDIISQDFQAQNGSEACSYNYDHIMDSVLFFYGPSKPLTQTNDVRKIVTDFTTEKVIAAATYLHATYASKEQTTYMYRFDTKPIVTIPELAEWMTVPHLFDLIFIWGVPYWVTLPEQEWDARDKTTSDIIMSFWTNFAKTSNLSENNVYPIRWDPFTSENPAILIIDNNFSMSDTQKINYKAFQFWNEYYPKVVNIATRCCNATDSGANFTFSHLFSGIIMVVCGVFIVLFKDL